MIAEFKGITQGVVGKKLPTDTTLNNMKKPELIKLLHVAQHNYDVLNGFYTDAVNVNIGKLNSFTEEHDKEIRNKAIDEFLEKLYEASESVRPVAWTTRQEVVLLKRVQEIAEQMKMR